MRTVTKSYHSLSLIWDMHRDHALMTAAIIIALGLGSALGAVVLPGL